MFDYDDYCTSESDESLPPSPIYNSYQSGNGYHAVPPPYTGTFMPPKPDLGFHNTPNNVETVHTAFNVNLSPTKPDQDLSPTNRTLAHIIEDWVSDSEDDSETKPTQHVPSFVQPNEQSKLVLITVVRPVTTVVPKISVTRPRQAKTVVTKPNLPPRRHINRSPSPKASNFPLKVTAVKAPMVNAAKGTCPIYLTLRSSMVDMLPLVVIQKVMCDKKNSVLFTDIEYLVLSPKFKLPDDNQVLLRIPRENNMYNVDLKNIVPSGDLTCLFAKATLDESNLCHRRLGHINFKTMNKLVKGKFNGKVDEGFLVGYSVSSKAFRVFNSRTQIVQETLHINFLENKPNVAGSSPTWLFDIDTLTKTMNYQPVTAGNQSIPSAGNTDGDAAIDEKEPEFEGRNPESEVNVSPSSSAQSKNHNDKTKREAKGKSPVESSTRYRNLNAEFEDFSDNSIYDDNA
nr:ribonuclease H-like domain-containing protein [Tanacetum cinerariifolium]